MKTLAKAFLLSILFSSSVMASDAGIKVGVVHFMKVVASAPQQQAVNKQLENEFKERGEELRKIQQEVRSIVEKAQRDEATLSQAQKVEISRDIEAKQTDFKLKEKAFQEDLKRRQMEERQKLGTLINQAIDKVAKAGNYDLVLNTEAVAFISQRVDITDQVIKVLSEPTSN